MCVRLILRTHTHVHDPHAWIELVSFFYFFIFLFCFLYEWAKSLSFSSSHRRPRLSVSLIQCSANPLPNKYDFISTALRYARIPACVCECVFVCVVDGRWALVCLISVRYIDCAYSTSGITSLQWDRPKSPRNWIISNRFCVLARAHTHTHISQGYLAARKQDTHTHAMFPLRRSVKNDDKKNYSQRNQRRAQWQCHHTTVIYIFWGLSSMFFSFFFFSSGTQNICGSEIHTHEHHEWGCRCQTVLCTQWLIVSDGSIAHFMDLFLINAGARNKITKNGNEIERACRRHKASNTICERNSNLFYIRKTSNSCRLKSTRFSVLLVSQSIYWPGTRQYRVANEE